jgi:hypothetical protein
MRMLLVRFVGLEAEHQDSRGSGVVGRNSNSRGRVCKRGQSVVRLEPM